MLRLYGSPTPPTAYAMPPSHSNTTIVIAANAFATAIIERVPIHEDNSHSGNRNIPRSGRNPAPAATATAPQTANDFSPFQQRQEQYAVNNEKNARCGRSGPSKDAYQNGGVTRS